MKRLETWSQDTPKMQLAVLLGTLKGELGNIEDGIKPENALKRCQRWIAELKQLGDLLPEEWPDDTRSP